MNEPEAMNNLINIGLDNMNMFQNPIFLHNHSLLSLDGTMLSGFKVGQTLGELDLGGSIKVIQYKNIITNKNKIRQDEHPK